MFWMEGRSTGPISSLIWLLGDSISLVAHIHAVSVVSYQHFFVWMVFPLNGSPLPLVSL